jgi:rubredoxin
MGLVETGLQCQDCNLAFVYQAKNRVEFCDVQGSVHFGRIISWDDKHLPHDIVCPRCRSSELVIVVEEGDVVNSN